MSITNERSRDPMNRNGRKEGSTDQADARGRKRPRSAIGEVKH